MTAPQAQPVSPEARLLAMLHADYRSLAMGVIDALDHVENWLRLAEDGERKRAERLHGLLRRTLVTHGIRPTAQIGGRLDLRYHEVVEARISASPPDTIIEIVEMGYELLLAGAAPIGLRRAKIAIASADANSQGADNE